MKRIKASELANEENNQSINQSIVPSKLGFSPKYHITKG